MPKPRKKNKSGRNKKPGIKKNGWYLVTFQLNGNLHVGSGRWGFVLPSRPYLPGWTLWGALTVLLKQTGRWDGKWAEVGNQLSKECWLGHFFLTVRPKPLFSYLPALKPDDGGRIHYAWELENEQEDTGTPAALPMVFRHGVTRANSGSADNLGRLFLHEMVRFDRTRPYNLRGLLYWKGEKQKRFPLEKGDVLRVGGNRQVSGGAIVCKEISRWKLKPRLLVRHHLQYVDGLEALGELERIVMRRTRPAAGEAGKDFKGFGQYVVDWGEHLVPGWETRGTRDLEPVWYDTEYRHGTVRIQQEQTGDST